MNNPENLRIQRVRLQGLDLSKPKDVDLLTKKRRIDWGIVAVWSVLLVWCACCSFVVWRVTR